MNAVTAPASTREAMAEIEAIVSRLRSMTHGWTTQERLDAGIACFNALITAAQAGRSGLREVATPGPKLRRIA